MVEKVKYALVLDKENFIPSPTPKHEEWEVHCVGHASKGAV